MSHLRLVTDPAEHQYQEPEGAAPGTPAAPCRHCGEESARHIARRCAAGAQIGPRCELDATYVVPWAGRRIPYCPVCAGMTCDLAMMFGLSLTLEPIAGGAA